MAKESVETTSTTDSPDSTAEMTTTEANTEDADVQSNTVREWVAPSLSRFIRRLRR
ncbi:hypothetical protein [Haladaptatus sp. W1]|uniref:hypothetical protein n=1 Tax=Haladaptatus sp. W1 TaxID=1897478 RepID=UPI001586932C|nr:hypothetical protein [Haladaptatus sp. W1]